MKKPTNFECEVKVKDEWVLYPVARIVDGSEVRCQACHGKVRVSRNRKPNGPRDHVEHKRSVDVDNCMLGRRFAGQHRLSDAPVS